MDDTRLQATIDLLCCAAALILTLVAIVFLMTALDLWPDSWYPNRRTKR